MSIEETRRVLEGYFGNEPGPWFAETIEYREMPSGETYRGLAAVREWLRRFLEEAFSDVSEENVRLTSGDGAGFGEWIFRGRHTGSLYGEASTGRVVELPMAAAYEIEGGRIVRARLYYDAATLRRQIGLSPSAG